MTCPHPRSIQLSPCCGAIAGRDDTCVSCHKTPVMMDDVLVFMEICVPCGAVLSAVG